MQANLLDLKDSERKLEALLIEFNTHGWLADEMVIATPVSNTDSLSEETLVGEGDEGGPNGMMINSNSLESVPSLCSEVIIDHNRLEFLVEMFCECPESLYLRVILTCVVELLNALTTM